MTTMKQTERREPQEWIVVEGARVNNLQNIDVRIPRNALTVVTGLSGSGKSSLAFDTLYAEGQRRYVETFSAYARNFLGGMERPDVDRIDGLSPVISIEQKTTNRHPRSTVGTVTEIYDYLRLLYARAATAYSPVTGQPMVKYTEEQILHTVLDDYDRKAVCLLAPMVKGRKGHYRELFDQLLRRGYLHVRVDGEIRELTADMRVDRYKNHHIEVVVDRLIVSRKDEERLQRSIHAAMQLSKGEVGVMEKGSDQLKHYSRNLMCPTSGISFGEPSPALFSFNSPEGACPRCKGLGIVSPDGDTDHNHDDDADATACVCPECHGARLKPEALHYRLADKDIHDIVTMDLGELHEWMDTLDERLTPRQAAIADMIRREIVKRLQFLLDVGLDYLCLDRRSATLSGGESQRIRLATQIGSQLVNVLYILDEPSIGLHQRDNVRLIHSLQTLRDMGNTVIVVEHDRDMMLAADYIVDIGPLAGKQGGRIVFQGTPQQLLAADTITARWLRGEERMADQRGKWREETDHVLTLKGCQGNNLKNIDVTLPLGKLICVTGVSGSGKSTLINDTLQPILSQKFYRSLRQPLPYTAIEGIEHIDKVISVDQSPIGRTPRSNPATYTGIFSDIRTLFVEIPEAKMRGYRPGQFSFNVKGGRCETCSGNGYKTIEMHLLPDIQVPCEACHGQRYNRATLEVRFKGKNIADVLNMTINEAVEFFENQPHILQKVKVLQDVGLGYIKLGQPGTTLSGGESQRVKLATELARRDTGKTLFILDEPTTGLHFADIQALLNVLRRLVDKGNTVIVIEHNMDVIRCADHIIDMGPDGGRRGGEVVVTGSPDEVARSGKGFTATFLKKEMEHPIA